MYMLAVLCLLLLQTGAHGFDIKYRILIGGSLNHQYITETAILETTVQVCRDVALTEGRDFTFPSQPFTAESVAAACGATKSSKNFQGVINSIKDSNVDVDPSFYDSARHHFDDETFIEGRKLITDGLSAVKSSNKQQNFEAARKRLGFILHPLQDFYSHSNWVEMENKQPNSNLIRPGTSIGNIADKSRKTCRNCDGDDCRNNILEDILEEKVLTSGYFVLSLSESPKLPGKCSHGGFFDGTKTVEPTGGINKDKFSSEHGHLHEEAAKVAIAATSELLEDIRGAAGDKTFLQMMGMTTGKPLCFVIDTTGSMGDDIATVRIITSAIINSKVGTEDEPSLYILVPFNDPDFGPLMRTTDPEEFKRAIDSLTPSGGGDFPEMSLSGLQLALTGAPPNSEIFLFTDAPAKDIHLKNTVIALIERTKSVVTFMITGSFGLRRRRDNDQQQQQFSRMTRSGSQLYRDLAQASGGQAIEVTKSELLEATTIITQSTSASLVTLLQATISAGKAENFTFTVDESVKNLTIYITGPSVSFTLISPSDVSQSSANLTGPLIITSQSVGNFQTLQLKIQVGVWGMKMMSTNAYTLKVVGDSPIDFLFDFLKVSESPFGGFEVLENRPRPGVNGTLRVTLTGSDSATVTEVSLVESLGSGKVNGSVEAQGEGDFIVRFDTIPSNEFVVVVKGQNNNSSSRSTRSTTVPFQRQSSTSITASSLSVTANDSDSILAPGIPLSVPFSVETSGAGGNFTISATNDQGFTSTFPSTLYLEAGGSANGTVNITAPHDTSSGTEVTMTIEVNAPGGADTNYAVLRLTVLIPVTDFINPVCQLLSLQSNCSTSTCSLSMWELSVQVTDEGSGVDRVSLRQGNGTMNTSLAAGNKNITLVSYNASCCSPDVELTVVDQVGNVGSCLYSAIIRTPDVSTTTNPTTNSPAAVVSPSTKIVQSFLLCLSAMILGLILPLEIS